MARNGKKVPKGKSRKGTQPSTTGKSKPVADQSTWRTKLKQSRLKFDDEQKQVYLKALAAHGMKGRSAETAGVCPQTVGLHRENDPDFSAATDAALDAYRDKFVDHATTLAYDGITVRKFNKDGDLIEERQDYPIRLIELELKRVEPDYRDKQTIDLNTAGGGVLVAPAEMTPEDWIKKQQEENAGREKPVDMTAAPGDAAGE